MRLRPTLLFCLLATALAAEDDSYPFAVELLERNSTRFPTEDLVLCVIERLETRAEPEAKLEARLIRAKLLCWQAQFVSPERRGELCMQAIAIYREFLEGGGSHPLFEAAQRDLAAAKGASAKALVEFAAAHPQEGAQARAEAVAILKEIADRLKTEAGKLYPAFKKAMADLDNVPDLDAPLPQRLVQAAIQAIQAYVPADQRYAAARMEQVEAYAASDPERKTVGHELAGYCEKQFSSGEMDRPGLETICMWYGFLKGRAHAALGEEQEARETWTQALDRIPAELTKQTREEALRIKLLIARDLIRMLEHGAEKDPSRWEKITLTALSIIVEYGDALLKSAEGCDLILRYAKAAVRQPEAEAADCEKAVRQLRRVMAQGGPWARSAARAMADVLAESKARRIVPPLDAAAWYETGHGFYLEGQLAHRRHTEAQEAADTEKAALHLDEARSSFGEALAYFRKAIGEIRRADADPLLRMQLEPKSWFESGLCLIRREEYAEALLAYNALFSDFAAEARTRWLPDAAKQKAWYGRKQVQAALEELDRRHEQDASKQGLLQRAELNMVYAYRRFRAQQPREAVPVLPPNMKEDAAFAAQRALDEAQALAAQARKEMAQGRRAEGVALFEQALEKFRAAATAFSAVPEGDRNRETALYQAPTCWALAQQLVSESEIAGALGQEKADALMRELGTKALEGYRVFQAWLEDAQSLDEQTVALRARRLHSSWATRASIHFAMHEWPQAVEAAEAFLSLEGQDDPDLAQRVNVLFTKFRALSSLAGEAQPPECDTHLEAALALAPGLQAKPGYYQYALQNLSSRFQNASLRAQKAGLPKETAARYEGRIADLQTLLAETQERPDLDTLLRIVHYRRESGRKQEAADAAERLLTLHDPRNRNARIEDERWPAIYENMRRIIRYGDLDKWKRCREEHRVLLDFLYDTAEGVNNDPERRPEHDRFGVDYEKAAQQIATIRAHYADCPTHRPKPDRPDQLLEGQSFLGAIEDEIAFRRKILGVRDLLSELALEVAEALPAAQAEEAKRYRNLAAEQIKILLEVWPGNSPDARIKVAQIHIANGEYDQALAILYEVRAPEPSHADRFIRLSRMISETYFKMEKWEDAAAYPGRMLMLNVGEKWIARHWPGIQAFVDTCYAKLGRTPEALPETAEAAFEPLQTRDEKLLAELERVRKLAKNDPQMLTPGFERRYELLKRKVAHFQVYAACERTFLTHRGSADRDRVLTPRFMERYNLYKQAVAADERAWRAEEAANQAIVAYGGVDQVPPEIFAKRSQTYREATDLAGKIAEMEEE